jgi:hypothetical protein
MPLEPLQIMQQLLLDLLVPAGRDDLPVLKQQPSDFVAPTSTWLPSIGKLLLHTWANPTAVSATAVKTDDAAVDVGVWDKRVSLVFPWDHLNMTSLRALVFGSWQRRIRWDFQGFMRTKHDGDSWIQNLLEGRRRRVSTLSGVVSASQNPQTGG